MIDLVNQGYKAKSSPIVRRAMEDGVASSVFWVAIDD